MTSTRRRVNGRENGIDRLIRLWPEIVATTYQDHPDAPELIKANATRKAAQAFLHEVDAGMFDIGCPDNPDHLALGYIIEAARALCAVDHAATLRLLAELDRRTQARVGQGGNA